jgi:Zn-finger nucleic acid-binding protein
MRRRDHKGCINTHHIEKCSQCSGLWIHTKEFESLTSERDAYLDSSVPDGFVRKPIPPVEGYLPCACCGNRMSRVNFRNISGVIIDYCHDCGCWLDAGELESIRAFVASGGLDKSQDREITTLKTDVQSIEGRVDQLEFMQKMLNRWKLKRIIFDGF